MSTAKELGASYSSSGQLKQPENPVTLNQKGVKFVRGFASFFDDDIVDIQEGFSIPGFSMGVNGTMVTINIPRKDGKMCPVPIRLEEDDFFLP